MISTNGSLPGDYSAREAQASGMVSVQAGCTVTQAIVLMKHRAHDNGVTLAAIADDVVNRRIRFDE